jgi:hypothetical protein
MHSRLPWCVLLALLVLQQGLAWLDDQLETRRAQRELIEQHDIEPAALFYTELAAAREGSSRIRAARLAATSPEQAPFP